jgi:hypothetical protein
MSYANAIEASCTDTANNKLRDTGGYYAVNAHSSCWNIWGHGNDAYAAANYYNHVNQCDQTYQDHIDGTRPAPDTYSFQINNPGVDNWVELGDAVDDLIKLREEIVSLSMTKVQASTDPLIPRPIIPVTPNTAENSNESFGTSKPARAAQINETIDNINDLWLRIKGSDDKLPTVNVGDRINKDDYKRIIERAQKLASEPQPAGDDRHRNTPGTYANHIDSGYTGKAHSNSYAICNNTWTGKNHCSQGNSYQAP